MTAAEFRKQWDERLQRERQQRWRPWLSALALLGLGMLLAGRGIVRATVQESPQWWFGGVLLLAAVAILLLVTPVSVIDFYRDTRDLIKWRALVRKERNER